jgi:hypothetical protein
MNKSIDAKEYSIDELKALLAECREAFIVIGKSDPYFMEWDLVAQIDDILPKSLNNSLAFPST